MIIPKTEYVEPTPASRPCPATYQDVINAIKELESQSKEKVSELESKLQAVTTENESLKASLSAKERDRALYYEKYQTVSKELEDIKAVLQAKEEAENQKRAENRIVINLDCTNSDYSSSESPSDDSQATMLFTHPALSLDVPAHHEATDNPQLETRPSEIGPERQQELESSDQFIEEIIQDELSNQQQPTTSGAINPTVLEENVREEIISTDAVPETPTNTAPVNKNRKRSLLEVMEALASDEQSPKRTKTLPEHTPMHFVCTFIPCYDGSTLTQQFDTMEQYRRHIADVHPERRFHCSKCPFTTEYLNSLHTHEKCHNSRTTFVGECTLCDIPLSRTHLKRHFTYYH